MKKTAVVICPGRGTYNKAELGYLQRHHANQPTLMTKFDAFRKTAGQTPISTLDGAARFSAGKHTRGDNASPLIYAASYFNAQAIRDEFDMLAVTGNSTGWYIALAVPPLEGRYPMRLPNHVAFHTHLQTPVAKDGQDLLGPKLFAMPDIPLVGGRGAVWSPKSCSPDELRQYTLGHQVTETYDFTLAAQTAAKAFAPDVFITTGPGTTLGGAVTQSLIELGWDGMKNGMKNKEDFQSRQSANPELISMGRDDQRHLVAHQ